MDILAALFIDEIELRQVPGPSTRIDLTGIQFSVPAPQAPPVTMAPHLAVIVHCGADEEGRGALEVVFTKDGELLARNVQPLEVEPGRFNYRLVRADLQLDSIGTVEAACRIDRGPLTVVPYTVLPPVG